MPGGVSITIHAVHADRVKIPQDSDSDSAPCGDNRKRLDNRIDIGNDERQLGDLA
jgi:hypothetical protein